MDACWRVLAVFVVISEGGAGGPRLESARVCWTSHAAELLSNGALSGLAVPF